MTKTARQIAFEILLKIEKDKAYSNLAIDSAVKAFCRNSTDCAFISRIVYGVIERKITLDYIISKHLNQPLNRLKLTVLVVLRMGVYQLVFSDKIPESAAVNESVKLVKNNKCGFAGGLVNAVLRKVADEGFVLSDDLNDSERFSVVYSAPKDFVNLLIYHYGTENTENFLKAALEPKKITIRVNTIKTTTDELINMLVNDGVGVEKTDVNNALYITLNDAVYELDAFKKGLFHVEDISSQCCIEALAPYPGCTMIDVCSAPGGKSFTAAEYMENRGQIYSCDVYESRTKLIGDGAKNLGIDCIRPTVNDGTVFNDSFPMADRVLCDVPCSGLGIITKKPEIKYKDLDEIKSLIPIQKKILDVSSAYVKSGGRLVYSTCSVNPNENRKVCNDFLNNHPEFKSVKALPHIERAIDEGDYLTLLPGKNNCDGFFIAVFEKE